MAETVQIGEKDTAELMELLGGFKTMLLEHERRIGIIETVLIEALPKPGKQPQDHRRKKS